MFFSGEGPEARRRRSGSATASWLPRRGFPPATPGTRELPAADQPPPRPASPKGMPKRLNAGIPIGVREQNSDPERQASGQRRCRYQSWCQSARLVGEDEQRARGGGEEFSVGGAEAAFGEDHPRAGFYTDPSARRAPF